MFTTHVSYSKYNIGNRNIAFIGSLRSFLFVIVTRTTIRKRYSFLLNSKNFLVFSITLENIVFPNNNLMIKYIINYCVKRSTMAWKNVRYLHFCYTSKYCCLYTFWRPINEMGVCTLFSKTVLLCRLIKYKWYKVPTHCGTYYMHKSMLSNPKIDFKVACV